MDDPGAAGAHEEGDDALPPTVQLWEQLAQPVDPWSAAEALLGMSLGAARLLAAILLLSSPEAEALLDRLPKLIRTLAMTTTSRPDRSSSEVRGPILWSETTAARSSSAGASGEFVFSIPGRAYDTAENRVLVAALRALASAGQTVDTRALRRRDSDLARLLSERIMLSGRWLEHRALSGIPKRRVTARDRVRTRTMTRRRHYATASDLLDRHAVPLTADDLALVADQSTVAQHWGLVTLIHGLRARHVEVPPLAVHQGILTGGPLTFIHERSRRGRTEPRAGIFLGGHAVDVPAVLEGLDVRVGRAPEGRPDHLFLGSAGDLDSVLDAAGF
jgi:hypothetical protein